MLTPIQAVSNDTFLPERLNLAIGKRCFVTCQGCYTHFGQHEPELKRLLESVSRFVDLGVRNITISGGDPLTINNLLFFLDDLRRSGVQSIKLDTVGTHLLDISPRERVTAGFEGRPSLNSLMKRLDFMGIPLDGWSNATVSLFRAGRPQLYEETIELLDAIDGTTACPMVIINTVAHAMNLSGLSRIGQEILRHPAVCHWNIFQFSPTDQVSTEINAAYYITDPMFHTAEKAWRDSPASHSATAKGITTEFRSVRSRLGQYLLINSDGVAWVPDERGQTISLGAVFQNEHQILSDWSKMVFRLRALRNPSARIET
jgi:Radical SAM superfamily